MVKKVVATLVGLVIVACGIFVGWNFLEKNPTAEISKRLDNLYTEKQHIYLKDESKAEDFAQLGKDLAALQKEEDKTLSPLIADGQKKAKARDYLAQVYGVDTITGKDNPGKLSASFDAKGLEEMRQNFQGFQRPDEFTKWLEQQYGSMKTAVENRSQAAATLEGLPSTIEEGNAKEVASKLLTSEKLLSDLDLQMDAADLTAKYQSYVEKNKQALYQALGIEGLKGLDPESRLAKALKPFQEAADKAAADSQKAQDDKVRELERQQEEKKPETANGSTVKKPDDGKKRIAFTFDDGPSKVTNQLLDALKELDIKATFFVIGENADAYAPIVKRMLAEGHQVGLHSFHHDNYKKLSDQQIETDVQKCLKVCKEKIGFTPTLFRFPYGSGGKREKAIINKYGMKTVFWDIDSLDWKSRNKDAVYQLVMKTLHNDAVSLMHSIYPSTVEAVRMLVPKLKAMGYEFVRPQDVWDLK